MVNTLMNRLRLGLQCFASVLLMVAVCLTLAAMFTAPWQVAHLHDEIFEHGLYRDCNKEHKTNVQQASEWLCFWKFDEANKINVDTAYRLQNYQVTCLILFGISCGLAILAIVCAYVTCCVKYCSIAWAFFAFCATIISLVGIIVFIRNAADSSNRFYHKGVQNVEQTYGSSFSMAVAGLALYLVATLIAGLCIVLACLEGRETRSSGSTQQYQRGIMVSNSTKV